MPMDGNSLRERRLKGSHKDHNDQTDHTNDIQPCLEGRKREKTSGRTPDGTGELSSYCLTYGRVELVYSLDKGEAEP